MENVNSGRSNQPALAHYIDDAFSDQSVSGMFAMELSGVTATLDASDFSRELNFP